MFPSNAYGETLTQYLVRRAKMIHRKVQKRGELQVRWHAGALLTYPWPTPNKRGHGVRGQLIAVYTPTADPDWIRGDLLTFAQGLDAESPLTAS